MGVFSSAYERELLEMQKETFRKLEDLAAEGVDRPMFIQQKNVPKYYDGVSFATLPLLRKMKKHYLVKPD